MKLRATRISWSTLGLLSLLAAMPLASTGCASPADDADETASDESDLTRHRLVERLAGTHQDTYRGYELETDPTWQLVLARIRIGAPMREFFDIPNFRMEPDAFELYERDYSGPGRREYKADRVTVSTLRLPKGALGQMELYMYRSALFLGNQNPSSPGGGTFHLDILKVDDKSLVLRTSAGAVLKFRAISLDHMW